MIPSHFPYQVISGSGSDWFYDPIGKTMAEIPRGTEIVQISLEPDSKGRVLVRAPFQFLMIQRKKLSILALIDLIGYYL